MTMTTITEIEFAIQGLPEGEFWKLAEWLDDARAKLWDEQMAADSKSGALEFLFQEACDARLSGTANPWPAAE